MEIKGIQRIFSSKSLNLKNTKYPPLFAILLITSLMIVTNIPNSFAAEGDVLQTIQCNPNSSAVGIAFDGTSIWYPNSFYGSSLKRCDLDGNALPDVPIVGASSVTTLSYDVTRDLFWGITTGRDIYQIEKDGTATLQYSVSAPGLTLIDGFAYDGEDDTLWVSPDVSGTIYHFDAKTGSFIESFSVPHASGNGCGNSGVATGNGILYLGFNGCNVIQKHNKSDLSLISSFKLNGANRVEDLECGETKDGVEVIWSKDAYDSVLIAFEVPEGTCPIGGVMLPEPEPEPPAEPQPISGIQCTYDDQTDVVLNGVLDYTVNGMCDIYRGNDVEMKNMTLHVFKELTQVTVQKDFNDFSSISGLTLNGDAQQIGNMLRLVPSAGSQSGSAYLDNKVPITEFSTQFQIKFSEPGGFADGLTFIIQNDEDGVNALGGGGGSLGYSGLSPSIAASFDIWVNGGCETARNVSILSNGNLCDKLATSDFDFVSDQVYYVWIDYDGIQFDVYISTTNTKPNTPIVSQNLDIPAILGTDMAYVGFTAATGGANANHDVLRWSFGQGSNTSTQNGIFTIEFDDESGSLIVNEQGQVSQDGNQIHYDGIITGVNDEGFEPVPQCGDVDADISLANQVEEQSIEVFAIPLSSASGSISISQCPTTHHGGGDNNWDTRPTFGVDHETREIQEVTNGFGWGEQFWTINDNHHTQFELGTIETGVENTFSAKVYASKGLKVQEFAWGIPVVGEAQNAESRVEVYYDNNLNIQDVKVVQNSLVIDPESISVSHEKVRCLETSPEKKCDLTKINVVFLETLLYNVAGIHAIDNALRDQWTFLNEGFEITGDSLNPMQTKMIPSNIRNQGLIQVTQLSKYSPYWQSDDGRMFEMNSFGSFKEINQNFERFQDNGDARTRLHSGFSGIVEFEKTRATQVFDSTKFISELPDSFGYHFEMTDRFNEKLIQDMHDQEDLAKGILEEMDKQTRHY